MRWLGVDMGGTATRWAICDATGAALTRGEAPGATGLVFDATSRAEFLAALAPAQDAEPLQGAYLGVTGAGFAAESPLRAVAAEALGLTPEKVTLVNDMVLAWHAVWPQGGGHLVAAGTGSVGFSLQRGLTLVGGRGTLIDDGGSGAWIALRALDAIWRIIDEHGTPRGTGILAERLFAALGGADWEDTRRFVYGKGRGAIGTLARPVAEAAHQGDPVALQLMAQAGTELARLARALIARAGPAPVAVIGGVIGLHPTIRAAFEAATPGIALSWPSPDMALCAAHLARQEFP